MRTEERASAWLVRDKDGRLWIIDGEEPHPQDNRGAGFFCPVDWSFNEGDEYMELDKHLFPSVTYEGGPEEVELRLKPYKPIDYEE